MKWLKRVIARWVDEAWALEETELAESGTTKVPSQRLRSGRGQTNKISSADHFHEDCFKNPLSITLYNALGGKIVKFYSYDHQNDKSHETTYIIPSEMDFEKELGKCIAMESLKHTR